MGRKRHAWPYTAATVAAAGTAVATGAAGAAAGTAAAATAGAAAAAATAGAATTAAAAAAAVDTRTAAVVRMLVAGDASPEGLVAVVAGHGRVNVQVATSLVAAGLVLGLPSFLLGWS